MVLLHDLSPQHMALSMYSLKSPPPFSLRLDPQRVESVLQNHLTLRHVSHGTIYHMMSFLIDWFLTPW